MYHVQFIFQENTDTFDENVARMKLQFTTLLSDLLHRISELGHESLYVSLLYQCFSANMRELNVIWQLSKIK